MLSCLVDPAVLINIKVFLIGIVLFAAGVKVKRYKYWVAYLMLILIVNV